MLRITQPLPCSIIRCDACFVVRNVPVWQIPDDSVPLRLGVVVDHPKVPTPGAVDRDVERAELLDHGSRRSLRGAVSVTSPATPTRCRPTRRPQPRPFPRDTSAMTTRAPAATRLASPSHARCPSHPRSSVRPCGPCLDPLCSWLPAHATPVPGEGVGPADRGCLASHESIRATTSTPRGHTPARGERKKETKMKYMLIMRATDEAFGPRPRTSASTSARDDGHVQRGADLGRCAPDGHGGPRRRPRPGRGRRGLRRRHPS